MRSVYAASSALRGLRFRRQVELPVEYKGVKLDCGCRVDIIVEEKVIIELKSVERIENVHEAQLLTYMRLSGKKVGLLFNFNSAVLSKGMIRRVL